MENINCERLIECRMRLGISKREAAKRIQVSQPAYLRYEAGTRNPSIQTISKMAEVFSTSTDYLLGKSSDNAPDKIIIDANKSPELFTLVETCKSYESNLIQRVITYAKKIQNNSNQ